MIREGKINGHRALWLENDHLTVSVLPDKGADIYRFIHNPSGVDFLMKTPKGLQPPGERPQAGFLENYEGAWQELFPSAGGSCTYRGKDIPLHGEVALLPWQFEVVRDDAAETAVRFTVRCRQTPFRLERVMRLRRGSATLDIEGTATNEGDQPTDCVWGHHVVLGGAFLEAGCRIDAPARTLFTLEKATESPANRYAAGQREPWPYARARVGGQRIDVREVPGPDARSSDDMFLTDLAEGWIAVSNPRLGLTFSLHWDATLFRYIVLWQPYNVPDGPLAGTYGLGVEPWTARYPLAGAVQHGEARVIAPGQSLKTTLRAAVSTP